MFICNIKEDFMARPGKEQAVIEIEKRAVGLLSYNSLMKDFWQALDSYCQKEWGIPFAKSGTKLKAKLNSAGIKSDLLSRFDDFLAQKSAFGPNIVFKTLCNLMGRDDIFTIATQLSEQVSYRYLPWVNCESHHLELVVKILRAWIGLKPPIQGRVFASYFGSNEPIIKSFIIGSNREVVDRLGDAKVASEVKEVLNSMPWLEPDNNDFGKTENFTKEQTSIKEQIASGLDELRKLIPGYRRRSKALEIKYATLRIVEQGLPHKMSDTQLLKKIKKALSGAKSANLLEGPKPEIHPLQASGETKIEAGVNLEDPAKSKFVYSPELIEAFNKLVKKFPSQRGRERVTGITRPTLSRIEKGMRVRFSENFLISKFSQALKDDSGQEAAQNSKRELGIVPSRVSTDFDEEDAKYTLGKDNFVEHSLDLDVLFLSGLVVAAENYRRYLNIAIQHKDRLVRKMVQEKCGKEVDATVLTERLFAHEFPSDVVAYFEQEGKGWRESRKKRAAKSKS